MSNLNSYNILINRFKAFADGHFLLKNFTYGAITLADLQKFGLYPFMHIVPVDVSYETGVKNFSFDIFFADLPREEENKAEYQKETLSDLQRIAEDLLGEITNHRVLFGYDCSVVSSRLVPFEEEFSNVLTGWNLSITLQIPYQWSACDTPASFNDFIVYNQSTGESSVLEFKDSIVREGGEVRLVNDVEFPDESYYYGTDENGHRGWFAFPTSSGLTCETLGACSTIIDMQTNIINLENDVEDLSANIVDVQMDITTIEGNITTLQSDVSDLETEVGLKANTSDISEVGFSNDYNDLDNQPTIPDSTSDLINDSGFITISDVPAQVNADWNSTSGVSEILNKPEIPTYTDFIEDAINNGVINKAPSENAVYDALALKFNIPTGTTTDYLDGLGTPTLFPESIPTATLRHEVKLGSTMTKGTPVYVSGADGTNMIVSPASNGSEATSSKTLGLLLSSGNTNAKVFVITEGLLAGLNTSTATIGDAVWLGSTGTLIYGLANKPYAPLHLVFIGIVTRIHANNGEIFVKVQNGFELNEIHNVKIQGVSDNDLLYYDSSTSLWNNLTNDKKSRNKYVIVESDFFGIQATQLTPFNSVTLNAGFIQNFLHSGSSGLGIIRILTGTSVANSGSFIGTTATTNSCVQPRHLQQMNMVFRIPNPINASTIIRAGFMVSASITADGNDGYYIECAGNSLYGKTAKSNVRSQTSSSFTMIPASWYHCRIKYFEYTIGAPYVEFELYNMSGTLLWSATLNTNVTFNSSSLLVLGYNTATTTQVELIAVDYLGYYLPTTQRGAL